MPDIKIRQGTEADDDVLVGHYFALWDGYGTPKDRLFPDAEERIRSFIRDARNHHGLGVFFADLEGRPVGSAACQIYTTPYPDVIIPKYHRYGYIWSVFVAHEHRGQGIAGALVTAATHHLRSLGCLKAVLHSSDAGESVYRRLGFERSKEMRLPL